MHIEKRTIETIDSEGWPIKTAIFVFSVTTDRGTELQCVATKLCGSWDIKSGSYWGGRIHPDGIQFKDKVFAKFDTSDLLKSLTVFEKPIKNQVECDGEMVDEDSWFIHHQL